jgi:parallel beta-helix repeat protein
MVRAGTYRENVVVRRGGTARAPITVRNEPGVRPVLTPSPRSPSYPLRLTEGAAYVRVRGFVIEQARGESTMNVVGLGEHPGAHDYEISDCEIRFARNSSGVFVDDTNSHVWLLGNTVHDNNEPGVQHQGIYFEGSDSVIANNVVYGQTNGFGIQVRAGADNVLVTHNTVSGNSLSGIVVENTAGGVRVVNNISAFNGGYAVRGLDEGGPVGRGNIAFNNLGFGNGDGEFADEGRQIVRFPPRGNLVKNPKFLDRAQADFRLREDSPALDRAAPEWTPAEDRAGAPRPTDRHADLGAYERR